MLRGCRWRLKRFSPLPKQYANTRASAAGSSWGSIGAFSERTKEDVLRGSWRSEPETMLVDTTMATHGSSDGGDAPKGSGTMAFPSAEDADAFMEALSDAQEAESKVPLMELTRNFYAELAKTADEELDAEGEALQEVKSDEERRDEGLEVQRQFFVDFYIAQGCIQEGHRESFLQTMTTSPRSYLVPEPGIVLSRLVVRHELESQHNATLHRADTSVAAAPMLPVEWMDGVFEVRPPQQHPIPHSSGGALEGGAIDTPGGLLEGGTHADITADTAAALAMVLEEDSVPTPQHDGVSLTQGNHYNTPPSLVVEPRALSVTHHSGGASPLSIVADLSLLELHWLQRRVCSGSIIDSDLLALLIPILLVGGVVGSGRPVTVATCVTEGQRVGNGNAGGDYQLDVLRFLKHEQWAASIGSGHIPSEVASDFTMLTLHRPLKRRRNRRSTDDTSAVDALLGATMVGSGSEELLAAVSRDVHAVDVVLPHKDAQPPKSLLLDAVLCAPRCSGDGIRPRVLLSSDPNAEGRTAANRAFDVIRHSADRCAAALLEELLYALKLLPPASTTLQSVMHCPRLVYAVNSMNPMECEAVVCAALSFARGDNPPFRGRTYRLLHPSKAFGAMSLEAFGDMAGGWGNGLTTWTAAEGAPPFCDCEATPMDTRREVAEAAWRLRPSLDYCNGSFVIVVERVDVVANSSSTQGNAVEEGSSGQFPLAIRSLPTRPADARSFVETCVLSAHTARVRALPWKHPGHALVAGLPLYAPSTTSRMDLRWTAHPLLHPLVTQGNVADCRDREVSSVWMLAILYARVVTSDMLKQCAAFHQWQNRIVSASVSSENDAAALLDECGNHGEGGGYVLLHARTAKDPSVSRLHRDVLRELDALMLVVHVVREGAPGGRDEPNAQWAIRCDAGAGSQTRDTALVEERLLSVRDSLCYLHRSLGLPFTRQDVLAAVGIPQSSEATSRPHQRSSRPTSRTSRTRPDVVERTHRRKLDRINRMLTKAGGAPYGSEAPRSWSRDVRTPKNREL